MAAHIFGRVAIQYILEDKTDAALSDHAREQVIVYYNVIYIMYYKVL